MIYLPTKEKGKNTSPDSFLRQFILYSSLIEHSIGWVVPFSWLGIGFEVTVKEENEVHKKNIQTVHNNKMKIWRVDLTVITWMDHGFT